MTAGVRNDLACQLCFAEPTLLVIAGYRIGEACHARLMAIAAEAATTVEGEIHVAANDGIACRECGACLEVDEETLTLSCPNGHAVELIAATAAPPSARICKRCQLPIERDGRRGRPPATHDVCRTPSDLAELAGKHRWLERQRAKKASLRSDASHTPAAPTE